MAEEIQEIKRRVREQFGGAGDAYVRSAGHRSGEDLRRLVEWAEPDSSTVALDVATGGGHTGLAIARAGGRVVFSDLTPAMLRQARRFVGEQGVEAAAFVAADAEALPFADRSFDLVTCRIAPHHFAHLEAAVREVARVLRPGGLFLLEDSAAPDDHELDDFINTLDRRRDPSHVRSRTVPEWRDLLAGAGFDVEREEIFRKRHDFADWTARARMTDADRAALDGWVRRASERCRAYFEVEVENGRVVAFTDEKVLLRARRRS